jgi:hypothetical protein
MGGGRLDWSGSGRFLWIRHEFLGHLRKYKLFIKDDAPWRDTSVVQRWATGWMIRGRVPAGAGNFSLHHGVQTGSGAHPDSYPMGTRYFLPGGKAAGAWSWPLTST